MNRRKLLSLAVSLLSVTALALLTIPFVDMMMSDSAARSSVQKIEIGELKNGSFMIGTSPTSGYRRIKYLIIRNFSGNIKVFTIPITHDGEVVLPDAKWGRPGGFCHNFGPDMDGSTIKREGVIKCQDDAPSGTWNSEWRWSYSGKNLGKYTENLMIPKYKIESNLVVLGAS